MDFMHLLSVHNCPPKLRLTLFDEDLLRASVGPRNLGILPGVSVMSIRKLLRTTEVSSLHSHQHDPIYATGGGGRSSSSSRMEEYSSYQHFLMTTE
jgi:hypothetical protein